MSLRPGRSVLPLLLLAAACGGGEGASAPASPPPDSAAVADSIAAEQARWVTIADQDTESKTARPEAFRASVDELRVIIEAGPTVSPFRPGILVANLLEGELSLPLESVRMDLPPLDTVLVDTTEVTAGPGTLYLFVAQQRGIQSWRVRVQERRPRAAAP